MSVAQGGSVHRRSIGSLDRVITFRDLAVIDEQIERGYSELQRTNQRLDEILSRLPRRNNNEVFSGMRGFYRRHKNSIQTFTALLALFLAIYIFFDSKFQSVDNQFQSMNHRIDSLFTLIAGMKPS